MKQKMSNLKTSSRGIKQSSFRHRERSVAISHKIASPLRGIAMTLFFILNAKVCHPELVSGSSTFGRFRNKFGMTFVVFILLTTCYLLLATSAHAATVSWDGGASTTEWNIANNWSNNAVPTNTTSETLTINSGGNV